MESTAKSSKTKNKFLLFIAVLFVLTAISGSLLAFYYENIVKNIIVSGINARLNTEAKVGNVELSIWKSFPQASLRFSQLTIYGKAHNKDTLAHLQELALLFSVLDLFSENYSIQSIEASNGFVNLFTDHKGVNNYSIFKQDTLHADSSAFSLALNKVRLQKIQFNLLNHTRGDEIDLYINNAVLKGNFSEEEFSMQSTADIQNRILVLGNSIYLQNKAVSLDLALQVKDDFTYYSIEKGLIKFENRFDFIVSGFVNAAQTDLFIEGKKMDFAGAIQLLPDEYKNPLEKYKASGDVQFAMTIKGVEKEKKPPLIHASFDVKKGALYLQEQKIGMSEIAFKGDYTNGNNRNAKSSSLSVNEFKCKLGEGELFAQFKLQNFDNPLLSIETHGKSSLDEMLRFFQNQHIESKQGEMEYRLRFTAHTKIPSKISKAELENAKASGHIHISNTHFAQKEFPENAFENVNGNFILHNSNLKVEEFSGTKGKSDFMLNGFMYNFLPFVFIQDEKLQIKASVQSNYVKLEDLLLVNASNSSDESLRFPQNMDFNLSLKVANFDYHLVKAKNFFATLSLNHEKLSISRFGLDVFEGNIEGESVISEADNGNFKLVAAINATQINIPLMFEQMKNFGQDEIQAKHLKGVGNAQMSIKAMYDATLTVIPNSIKAQLTTQINKGELIEHEAMKEIALYFKSNKILSKVFKADELEKKLKHIYFDELTNTIEINNAIISIPRMRIASSVMKMELEGTHSFKDEINYYFSFNISSLMEREKSSSNEFGEIAKDEKGDRIVHLHITGTTDDYKIQLHKKSQKDQLKQHVQTEKESVKQLIIDELKGESKAKPKSNEMQFEWDENEDENSSKTIPKDTSDKKSFNEKLKDKLKPKDKKGDKVYYDWDDE